MRLGARSARLVAPFALLAAAGPLSAAPDSEWVRLVSDDSHIVAFLPDVAKRTQFSRWVFFARIDSVSYQLYREVDGCEITITELPGLARWLGGPEGIYRRAREDLLSEVRGREVAYRDAERSDVAGKRLAWSNEEAEGLAEFYIFADHVHVFACYAKRDSGSNLAESFFAALALRDPGAEAQAVDP